jgi:hypothetical protein
MGGDRIAISSYLAEFKENGIVSYNKVLQIPVSLRIPELIKTKNGRLNVLSALSASLKSAFSNINVKYGFNEEQIVELADKIIDTSHEDNLSIEDVLLFLGKLLMGDYGKIDYKFDLPYFFELFENYRQERHTTILRYREEQLGQFRAIEKNGTLNNIKKDRNVDSETMQDLLKTAYSDDKL